MKDAFGGSFIIKIMIIFFVFFISFMVIAVNFAKTYSVKNGIIDIIEHSPKSFEDQVFGSDELGNAGYLNKVNYSPAFNPEQITKISNDYCKGEKVISQKGVCIELFESFSSSIKDVYYYRVTTYMVVDTPFFNLGIYIPISGETKTFNNIFN